MTFGPSTRTAMSEYIRSASAMLEPEARQSLGGAGATRPGQRRTITSRFNFDTYKLVRQLERQGFTRGQAVAIMKSINAVLVDSTLSIRSGILSKTDLENQTYLYKAHLQELRNELQLLRQNDSAQLKSDTEQILRDTETMNAKFSELVGNLKSDVSMDLNNHKTDGREIGTDTDLSIQEIHHKLIVKISDLKTKIETMKVETTRFIVWIGLCTFAILMSVDWISPTIASAAGKSPEQPPPQQQPPPPIISAFPHPLRAAPQSQQQQLPQQPAQPSPQQAVPSPQQQQQQPLTSATSSTQTGTQDPYANPQPQQGNVNEGVMSF
ncbi:uncharacterized protein EV422DRAFT_567647 [Fimicolochytrium jonesii]|uniref:uncharacterized protein n=1 Tax=Fimicolochytrium jonesii TaxID=1396493 RepID=UPI0022FE7A7A|nr:uncharacterized protein EV422DRAFT_567647 [Fimicolochytrium jonesii]KAI8820754.1 hypothetical protein EV422DRAFT_567647 [Fimicolochytrium jonesii]